MSEDYLKMFTGVVLLIFVIIAGYFFSERNDRKMFLLSSLVFLVINIACLYVLTASQFSARCCSPHEYSLRLVLQSER